MRNTSQTGYKAALDGAPRDSLGVAWRPNVRHRRYQGAIAVGINELILVGTGFVIMRVLFVWYRTPAKTTATDGNRRR